MFGMLRQVVSDLEPGRFVPDKDVCRRADCRFINERAQCNVDESPGTDDGIQKRATYFATNIVISVFGAENQNVLFTVRDPELVALDTGEGLESRTCRPPTIGAVAIQSIAKFVRYRVVDCAA
jgi:hypothetical protein